MGKPDEYTDNYVQDMAFDSISLSDRTFQHHGLGTTSPTFGQNMGHVQQTSSSGRRHSTHNDYRMTESLFPPGANYIGGGFYSNPNTMSNGLNFAAPPFNGQATQQPSRTDMDNETLSSDTSSILGDEDGKGVAGKKITGPFHNAKYKAKMCKNWVRNGNCPYNEKCQFAHGSDEVDKWAARRVKTQLLKERQTPNQMQNVMSSGQHAMYHQSMQQMKQMHQGDYAGFQGTMPMGMDDTGRYRASSQDFSGESNVRFGMMAGNDYVVPKQRRASYQHTYPIPEYAMFNAPLNGVGNAGHSQKSTLPYSPSSAQYDFNSYANHGNSNNDPFFPQTNPDEIIQTAIEESDEELNEEITKISSEFEKLGKSIKSTPRNVIKSPSPILSPSSINTPSKPEQPNLVVDTSPSPSPSTNETTATTDSETDTIQSPFGLSLESKDADSNGVINQLFETPTLFDFKAII